MWVVLAIALIGSFALCLALTGAMVRVSRFIGFVDRPGGHKGHRGEVALGGGVAIVLSTCLPILAAAVVARFGVGRFVLDWLPEVVRANLGGLAGKWPTVCGILGCCLGLHFVGLIDDVRPLGPGFKLVVQLIAGVVTAWGLGIRAAEFLPIVVSIAITTFWIVLITNAFNFLDNMDGLSGGVGALCALVFALASLRAEQVFVPTMASLLAGSLAGFLVLNFAPARIFMGDAGSLVVGYLLSVLTILTTYYDAGSEATTLGVIVPLMVLAVPLYDVISVVVRRVRSGHSPFRGDRRHFSHRLVQLGMSVRGAVLTIYLATLATGLPAILLPTLDWTGAVLLLVQCACVVVMIAVLEHRHEG